MTIKTTPTDIRYEYMHIDMTNIFLNLFAKIISFTPLSLIIIYISSIILLWKDSRNMNRGDVHNREKIWRDVYDTTVVDKFNL